MREILFRGKSVDNSEWVYGYFVHQYGANEIYLSDESEFERCHIDPETLGQGVGITDKNGKEIFEGDIVTGIAYSQKWVGSIIWIKEIASFGLYHGHEIAFENCSILKRAAKGMNDEFTAEIIGNIHDNPELLKENEEV